jgi:cysteinyl-tRNA synthetase
LGPASEPDAGYQSAIIAELNQDLNTPKALALVWDMLKSPIANGAKKASLRWLDAVLGLSLDAWSPTLTVVPEAIQNLLALREQARQEQRWQQADALRAQIESAGFQIEDRPDGARIQGRSS